MSENRPRSPDRKLGLVAPISIAIVVAVIVLGAVLFRGRISEEAAPQTEPPPPPAAPVVKTPPSPPSIPPIPSPEAAVGRRELLAEAGGAAAAYAANSTAPPGAADRLAGRRFTLRIPFGCEGPQVRAGVAQAFYEFDPDKRTIRLVARPAVWTALPMLQELDLPAVETVEGFWIPHPWTNSETCPKRRERPPPAAPTPPAAQTLGLAQLFEKEGSRIRRRGERPYEHVIKLGESDRPPLAEGFRLVLEGRLSTFPNGRVTHCWSESPDHRPICLLAAQLDRIAFEGGGDGRMIAEWRN